MSHEHRLRLKTLIMVLLMVVCANVGDLLLKRGMLQIGEVTVSFSGLLQSFVATLHNGTIWLGILFLIGFTLSYMTAVSWADYSYVMPAGAFGYAVQTMLAVLVLHEVVTPRRWIGVAMICIGVLLVGQTKPNTTNPVPSAGHLTP
jgi:drug/metabolite transporter (DMT)-like permease